MKQSNAEVLQRYVGLVSRKLGGVEALRHELAAHPPSVKAGDALESFGSADVAVEHACRALEAIERHRPLDATEHLALEAIIDAELRPAMVVVDGSFQSDHRLWRHLSADAAIRARIEACLPAVGRIELPGHSTLPYAGTGFVVGAGLVMTNRHVAEIFVRGVGSQGLNFRPGIRAGVDFLREQGRATGPTFRVRSVAMVHPYWDMALLEIDGIDTKSSLVLSTDDARDMTGREIFVVGYPAFDPRNPQDEQDQLFGGRYGIKRLQPGELHGASLTASFGKHVRAATHDCSTLGGNSGSAVIDLETGSVLALHFGGRYRDRNFAVPAAELARDARVVNAGVRFAAATTTDPRAEKDWWGRVERLAADALSSEPDQSAAGGRISGAVNQQGDAPDGAVSFEIPLRITVALGGRGASAAVAAGGDHDAVEAMRKPWSDANYASRRGYDPNFLNETAEGEALEPLAVPLPTAADPAVLALTHEGLDVLHYENFSLRMHAKRRLALITAANVTKEGALRRPEPERSYSRAALAGLGKNDQERWFPDPRLDARHQLPDVFFTKDRRAFDKGHLVRRDDVAWGATYLDLRRANGDTYHVTNCSPQVAGFNRSNLGEDNWGDLENHVLSEASTARLCVLAGPVLDPDDEVFVGVGDGNTTLRAKIPTRYWKVVVARDDDGLAAFGFVLEQDLSQVAFEFVVPENFTPAMYPISEIADIAGVVFDPVILEADRYDSVQGTEMAMRCATPRRRRVLP